MVRVSLLAVSNRHSTPGTESATTTAPPLPPPPPLPPTPPRASPETLHEFSSATAIRNYTFSLDAQRAICDALWGGAVAPDTAALTRRFGGYAIGDGIAGVTNLIWSNGPS